MSALAWPAAKWSPQWPLRLPLQLPFWLPSRPAELRIDVDQRHEDIERELDAIERRMARAGDRLHGLEALPIGLPGFVFRHRVADGEHYVYAIDAASGRLAGYTVFNRLVEVDRRADRYLRAPHSKYRPAWQRRGIATAVHRWWLAAGNCMISGARLSPGAHALWLALARDHPLAYVRLRDRKLAWLSLREAAREREELGTRMILFGRGWDGDRLGVAAGVQPACAIPAWPGKPSRQDGNRFER